MKMYLRYRELTYVFCKSETFSVVIEQHLHDNYTIESNTVVTINDIIRYTNIIY